MAVLGALFVAASFVSASGVLTFQESLELPAPEAAIFAGVRRLGGLTVLALAILAIRRERLGRAAAVAMAVSSAAVALMMLTEFVPLFDGQPGPLANLMQEGQPGAKALFFAAVLGAVAASAAAIKPEPQR